MKSFKISIWMVLSAGVLCGQDYEQQWEQDIRGRSGSGVALGDVDGDGDVDAVLCQSTDDSVLLLNDGSGFFAKAEVWLMPKCTDGELADLDGDGDLDFFLGQHLGECGVSWNDGSGGFSDSGQVIGSQASRSEVLLVDVDGDGDLDAVLPANSSSNDSVLWLNSGAGVFVDSGLVFGSFFARDVAAGDVDLVFGINGRNKLFLNDGDGVFAESGVTFATDQTFGVAFGDLDGDEDLDLFVVNGNQTSGFRGNKVWVNDGSGGFTNSGQDLGDDYSFDVLLHDVDDDGDLDAVEGTNVAFENHLWANDGSGNFSEAGIDLGDARVSALAMEDLNGDGREDFFAVANQEPSEVWLGGVAPDLLFDSGQRLGGVSAQSVVSGDLDGDGDIDAVIGTLGGKFFAGNDVPGFGADDLGEGRRFGWRWGSRCGGGE